MHFKGSKRFLNAWYEIQGTTNRQDALETMIVLSPIGFWSARRTHFVLLMTPAPKDLGTAEQKPNKPIVQGRRP
jgi:hypothetical protein